MDEILAKLRENFEQNGRITLDPLESAKLIKFISAVRLALNAQAEAIERLRESFARAGLDL